MLGLPIFNAAGDDGARDPVVLAAIGQVRNRVRRPMLYGWAGVESDLVLTASITEEMLTGLQDYSHIIVVFWIDRLGTGRPRPSQLRPGGTGTPLQGILATRSQLRPNPLGVAAVPLLDVTGGNLRVRGLDAIDGTPILDLKPYIPFYDSVPNARVPEWILEPDRSHD